MALCDDILILITQHYLDILLDVYVKEQYGFAIDAVNDLRNYIEVFPKMSQCLDSRIDAYSATLDEKCVKFVRSHGDRRWKTTRNEFKRVCCLSYIKRHLH